MSAWRRFTAPDWDCFAGAERFPDGTDPLRADLEIDGHLAEAIADPSGVTIFLSVDTSHFVVHGPLHLALLLGAGIPYARWTLDGLRALGFEVSSGDAELF